MPWITGRWGRAEEVLCVAAHKGWCRLPSWEPLTAEGESEQSGGVVCAAPCKGSEPLRLLPRRVWLTQLLGHKPLRGKQTSESERVLPGCVPDIWLLTLLWGANRPSTEGDRWWDCAGGCPEHLWPEKTPSGLVIVWTEEPWNDTPYPLPLPWGTSKIRDVPECGNMHPSGRWSTVHRFFRLRVQDPRRSNRWGRGATTRRACHHYLGASRPRRGGHSLGRLFPRVGTTSLGSLGPNRRAHIGPDWGNPLRRSSQCSQGLGGGRPPDRGKSASLLPGRTSALDQTRGVYPVPHCIVPDGGGGGAPVLPARTAVVVTKVPDRTPRTYRIPALRNNKGHRNQVRTHPVPGSPNAFWQPLGASPCA